MSLWSGVILNGTDVINAPTIVGSTVFDTNDQTITFGRALAAASTRLSQDTTRAQLVLGLGTALGSQLVIGANAWIGRDFDHAAPANPTLFIHDAIDPDVLNTHWVSITHDGAKAMIGTGLGSLWAGDTVGITPPGGAITPGCLYVPQVLEVSNYSYLHSTVYTDNFLLFSSGPFDIGAGWRFSGTHNTGLYVNAGFGQMLCALNDVANSSGNQLIIGSFASSGKDYDHAPQTNPTIFIHSATDPDVNNTQWLSLAHDQTNGVITTGKGELSLNGFNTYVSAVDAGGSPTLRSYGTANPLLSAHSTTGNIIAKIQAVGVAGYAIIGTESNHDFYFLTNNAETAKCTVGRVFYVGQTQAAATNWISLQHDSTNSIISNGAGNMILNPITEITEVCGVGLKTKEYNLTLDNGAKVNLPAGTGWGTFMIGDNQEYARIRWTAAAVVTLDEGTANVATADTPAFFCLYDDVATVAIKNNLGVNLTLRYVIHYS